MKTEEVKAVVESAVTDTKFQRIDAPRFLGLIFGVTELEIRNRIVGDRNKVTLVYATGGVLIAFRYEKYHGTVTYKEKISWRENDYSIHTQQKRDQD